MYRGPVPPLLEGFPCEPLRPAVYGSEHPTPSTCPPCPLHPSAHAFIVSAVNACFVQLCPDCSNRTEPFTVCILYMFCGITGLRFDPVPPKLVTHWPCHSTLVFPTLHDSVPSPYANTAGFAVESGVIARWIVGGLLSSFSSSPTVTSGPLVASVPPQVPRGSACPDGNTRSTASSSGRVSCPQAAPDARPQTASTETTEGRHGRIDYLLKTTSAARDGPAQNAVYVKVPRGTNEKGPSQAYRQCYRPPGAPRLTSTSFARRSSSVASASRPSSRSADARRCIYAGFSGSRRTASPSCPAASPIFPVAASANPSPA